MNILRSMLLVTMLVVGCFAQTVQGPAILWEDGKTKTLFVNNCDAQELVKLLKRVQAELLGGENYEPEFGKIIISNAVYTLPASPHQQKLNQLAQQIQELKNKTQLLVDLENAIKRCGQ